MRENIEWDRAEALAYRIALNLASNLRRKRRLWNFVTLGTWEESGAQGPLPHEAMDRKREEHAVRRAVQALPERYRKVLVLTEFSDLKYAEVAEILGIAEGTVASRRSTAMAKLQQKMKHWERTT